MLRAIEAVVKSPVFSIQRPLSYQVADSLTLPQPSTLVGALAYCMAKASAIMARGTGDTFVRELIATLRRGLARIAARPLVPIMLTPIILSRLRTLELSSTQIAKRINKGKRLSDAMVREHASGAFSIYFLFLDEEIAEKAKKAIYLLSRIGDTESLTSVSSIYEMELLSVEKQGSIDTYTPCTWIENVSGNFVVARLCNEEYAELSQKIIKGKPADVTKARLALYKEYSEEFYLPFAIKLTERGYIIYKPTSLLARAKSGYVIAHLKAQANNVKIVVKEEWLS